ASSVWSHLMGMIPSPSPASLIARPVANTVAPACARPTATPRPTPRLAPVTSATRPLRSVMSVAALTSAGGTGSTPDKEEQIRVTIAFSRTSWCYLCSWWFNHAFCSWRFDRGTFRCSHLVREGARPEQLELSQRPLEFGHSLEALLLD